MKPVASPPGAIAFDPNVRVLSSLARASVSVTSAPFDVV